MKHLAPVLALAAGLAAPLPALSLIAPLDTRCDDDLAALERLITRLQPSTAGSEAPSPLGQLLEMGRVVYTNGYCVVSGITFPPAASGSPSAIYQASALRWQAEWADDTRPMPPNRLIVEVPRASMNVVPFGDPEDAFSQMLRYQSKLVSDLYPNEFRLELSFDPDSDVLEIWQIAGQNANLNRIEFSATLRNADLDGFLNSDEGGMLPFDKLTPMTIERADLALTNSGLFENMAMSWLSLIYPALGDTPEAAVAALQALAKDQVASAPEALIGPDSRAALNEIIDSLPHPLGTARLTLDAPKGIMPSRVAATQLLVDRPGWASFGTIFDGATLNVEWTKGSQPPRMLPPLYDRRLMPEAQP
ncbi:MAG: hypothetical protein Q4G26_14810 [Paracoccus sp. (in: a-proteobacteria)]|nr:hypothetical protein [Paracoccus sp. (in: a-proteobacteria)]